MEEALQIAAQCWFDEETQDREMDFVLAEAVAKRIAAWMETAAQNQLNADYYRGLLERCGKAIGDRAYTQNDGGRSEDVLCAKIPEIVETDYANGAGQRKRRIMAYNELNQSSDSVSAEDVAKAILDCAEEELQARLSGMTNGFDHPNAQILFGRAKAMAQEFISQNAAKQ